MPTARSSPPLRGKTPSRRRSGVLNPSLMQWKTPDAPAMPRMEMTTPADGPLQRPPSQARSLYDVTSPRPTRQSQASPFASPRASTSCLSPAIALVSPSPVPPSRSPTPRPTHDNLHDTPTPPRPARRRYDSPRHDVASELRAAQVPSEPERYDSVRRDKRDSTQRRLSALRGLVASIDFNQPWSLPDTVEPATRHHIDSDHGWNLDTTPKSRPRNDLHTPDRPHPRWRREEFEVASSGYNKSCVPSSPIGPPTPDGTWRSTLASDSTYIRLLDKRGPDEIQRQEIMWEMCETEQAFIRSMRHVLRLFATPLKTPQGKWIDGIPDSITDLFDALESVAHVHGILAAAQRNMRRKTEILDLAQFLSSLEDWIPKLEIYGWYLVRFEPVVALVEEHVRDSSSVFGEFVRMQLKDDALGSMSLGSMLLKPVQRLMKYPLFLKRLLDATRRHTGLLSLLSTTESIIHSLQANKAREEDYHDLQSLESRLSGLPPDFVLAERGRKLLGQGVVQRLHGPLAYRSSIASSDWSFNSSPWESPSPSRQSSFSVSSCSSSGPSRAGSLRMSPSKASVQSPRRQNMHRSPSNASSISRPGTPNSIRTRKNKDEIVVFVFDDLVILTHPHEKGGLFSSKSKRERGWRVLSEGGIGRVLDVKEGIAEDSFTLTISPLANQPLVPVTLGLCVIQAEPASPSRKLTTRGKCPILSTLQQFCSALAEAVPVDPYSGKEPQEILFHDLDNHPLHSLQALGYAQ